MKFRPLGAELLPENGRAETTISRFSQFCERATIRHGVRRDESGVFQHHMQADSVCGLNGELRTFVVR
jgi:hypothetical protein